MRRDPSLLQFPVSLDSLSLWEPGQGCGWRKWGSLVLARKLIEERRLLIIVDGISIGYDYTTHLNTQGFSNYKNVLAASDHHFNRAKIW